MTGRPAAFQASKPPMRSVAFTRPRSWSEAAARLEAVLARHPGSDEVVLHVLVGSREVTVHAGRYHVQAGAALAAELDEVVGPASTRVETVRPKAQSSNGNGRGKPGWKS